MKRMIVRYVIFLCLVVLPLPAFVLLFRSSERELELLARRNCRSFYAEVENQGSTEFIMPWKDEAGGYYLVLPSYAVHCNDIFLKNSSEYGITVLLNGEQPERYLNQSADALQGIYAIEFRDSRGRIKETAQLEILCSANLPAVFVTTSSGNMDTIHASKENKEKGTVSIYTQEGIQDYKEQLNHIKGRGNVTWEQAKKPYNLSLQNSESLLGMNTASEWALLAGAMDNSYIRNKLTFDMAQSIGLEDTSDAAFVDLYLNGGYAGLYMLTEKVGITAASDASDAGEEYLLEIEMQERLSGEEYGFLTDAGQAIVMKGRNNVSEMEINRMKVHLQSLEDAVYREDWETVWNLLDQESYITIYLMEEILQNHDAYISSQYMRLFEQNGEYHKIYSGPVWDFDGCLSPKDGMYAATLTAGQSREGYPKFWITKMVKNKDFQRKAAEKYREIKRLYLERQIWEDIDFRQEQLERAVEMDCLRWKQQSKENWYVQVQNLKNYLADRLEFLDALWIEQEIFHKVHVEAGSDTFSGMDYYVKDGQACTDLPRELNKSGYTFAGWYLTGTNSPFLEQTPIYQDLSVEARWTQDMGGGILEKLRSTGLLQMRYILFIGITAGTGILFLYDSKKLK